MKKKISANDCKAMFNDKFSSLTMKELGIEWEQLQKLLLSWLIKTN